jgi:hypothetical protein
MQFSTQNMSKANLKDLGESRGNFDSSLNQSSNCPSEYATKRLNNEDNKLNSNLDGNSENLDERNLEFDTENFQTPQTKLAPHAIQLNSNAIEASKGSSK